MKRTVIVLTLIVVIAGLAVASLPLLLSSEAVRERITTHVMEITGLNVSFRGDPSVSFSPFLGIEISEVELVGANNEPLLKIERVKGKLNLLSAITGDIALQDFQFLRPRLMLKTDTNGVSNWYFERGELRKAFDSTVAAIQNPESPTFFSSDLGSYDIKDGVVEYVDEIDGTVETITNINATLGWANTADSLFLSGTAVLRNENGSIEFVADSPMHLIAGGESNVSVQFSSEPFEFVFEGKANTISDLFAKGELRASTPSIVRLSDFLQLEFGDTNAIIGKWEAAGVFEGTANMALLSEAKIGIGDNEAVGVVGLSRTETGKAKLDGTLAFNEIDLSNYLQTSAEAINKGIRDAGKNNVDVDLRLSANAMNAGNLLFEDVAASITSGDGGWKFDIGNATAFGGTIVASFGSVTEGENTQLILKLASKDTDLAGFGTAAGQELPLMTGTGNIKADLRTPLPILNPSSIPINGEISVSSNAGIVHGIDFENLFGLVEEPNANVPRQLDAEGQTVFDELTINAFLSNSRATISKALIMVGGKSIQIHGDADILNGSLALSAQEISEEGPVSDRLIIGGTFSSPLVSLKPIPKSEKARDNKTDAEIDENSSASH